MICFYVSYTGVLFKRCLRGVCGALIEKEEELNELDRGSGDGDCGSTLAQGARGGRNISGRGKWWDVLCNSHFFTKIIFCMVIAILYDIDVIPWDTPSKALLAISELVENHMGGTSGAVS